MSSSERNGKEIRRAFGGSGNSATVSSLQFHINHTYEYHPTKEQPWNSPIKVAAPTYNI